MYTRPCGGYIYSYFIAALPELGVHKEGSLVVTMSAQKSDRLASRVYRGEGASRAPKWERSRSARESWCVLCSDYTEHDVQGCVECYDPEKDVSAVIESSEEEKG